MLFFKKLTQSLKSHVRISQTLVISKDRHLSKYLTNIDSFIAFETMF